MRGTPASRNEVSTSKVEMLGTHADVNPKRKVTSLYWLHGPLIYSVLVANNS
jgi:hypothetical protein